MDSSFKLTKKNNAPPVGKDDLPQESLSEYYEERKKILFKKMNINKCEETLLNIIKKSQLIVNKETEISIKGGFFKSLPSNIYDLSNHAKENIANFCLILSLYFQEGKEMKALKLFLLMCEQNKKSIIYLTSKIVEQLPKISNTNKIAKFYPTITKTMLLVLGIFIKLSGKFNKCILENFYITLYFKIIYVLSNTVIKCNPGNNDEISNQLKNERRYFYSSCLFDSSLYLFNRYQPLSACTYILQHILELYGNKLTFVPNEIESILLLKVNYNLGLFYYVDGHYNESIFNLNQARERLLEIKYFPIIQKPPKTQKMEEGKYVKFDLETKSTNNIYNFNNFLANFNKSVKFSRNKNKRTSVNEYSLSYNESNNKLDKQTLIAMIKEKNLKTQREYELKREIKKKKYSTIYLGANSLLNFKDPILIEQVREKILIEIELLLSEIELNHKNYRESLHHINDILSMQSNAFDNTNDNMNEDHNDNNNNNNMNSDNSNLRGSTKISKSRTLFNLTKITTSTNGVIDSDEKRINNANKLKILLKNSESSDHNLIMYNKKKSENISSNIFNKIKIMKYHLSSSDKNRIMLILEQIESKLNGDQDAVLVKKAKLKFSNNFIIRNENLNKKAKIITSKEMEKFFIFICGLSVYQLKILNDSQPAPSQRRNDLPIIFNNQFQDCLTNAQRMSLSLLETMSLTRYILLKDSNKDISLENLDYRFMKYRIKEADSEEEYFNKSKNRNYVSEFWKEKRRSSRDSNFSIKALNNNNQGNQKFMEIKKVIVEYEEENTYIDIILNKIKTENNKDFIDLHKRSIIKLLNQMNKEELKVFLKCPKLLKQMIDNISKDYEIKENGAINNNKLCMKIK